MLIAVLMIIERYIYFYDNYVDFTKIMRQEEEILRQE